MYGLIQSGQISAVFEARTKLTDNTDKPQWYASTYLYYTHKVIPKYGSNYRPVSIHSRTY